MAEVVNLRNALARADGSAETIQEAARAMIRHYDRSTNVAVTEWRNVLHQARQEQYLPLLYVANETLQISKRNRGNKFLEAFSPILGQSLVFMCQKNPSVVEKIRRTVKIWGDRRVFSVRFVNEVLKGLEPFRNTGGGVAPFNVSTDVTFSPLHEPPAHTQSPKSAGKPTINIDKELSMDGGESVSSSNFSDDDNLFGDSGDRLLNIDLDLDKAASAAKKDDTKGAGNRKRRRNSPATNEAPTKRRSAILSTNSLMELWNQVSNLQQRFDSTQTMLAAISPEYLNESSDKIDTLVGDELLDAYKKNLMFEKRVVDQRVELHYIAKKRKSLEQEAVRYLPWLEGLLRQDADDISFCDKVLVELKKIELVHAVAKAAREERLAEEARQQYVKEEQEKKKKEEEDRKKFMEIAMAKQTEAEPGMVWNKAAGEYQYRSTDESWRD